MAGFFSAFNVFDFNVNGIFTANTTLVDFGNVSINTTTLFINTATVGVNFSLGRALVGNSTSNSTINSTSLKVSNGSFVANYGVEEMTLTDGTLTSKINSSGFSVVNTTTGFFTCNATNLRLGVAGSLANLTPTRLELGSGTTFIGPTGLSIAGGATMNSIHLDVDSTIATTITANFSGNSARLDTFGPNGKGIVGDSDGDANSVLRSSGQWIKSGVFWHSSGRGALNQTNLDMFWTGQDYSKVEISGWLRPNDDNVSLRCKFSHDGSTFTGFDGDYQRHRTISTLTSDATSTISDSNDFFVGDAGNLTSEGVFFIIEIHNHHGLFSTYQAKSAYREAIDPTNMVSVRTSGLISNTNTIEGIRFTFDTGNIRDHKFAVKVFPN